MTTTRIKIIMQKIASKELWAWVAHNLRLSFIVGAIITSIAQYDRIQVIADQFARQWSTLLTVAVVAGLIFVGILFEKVRGHW